MLKKMFRQPKDAKAELDRLVRDFPCTQAGKSAVIWHLLAGKIRKTRKK